MEQDINDSDDPRAYPELYDTTKKYDQLNEIQKSIENQYKNFEFLGENLIKKYENDGLINDDDKLRIYSDMIAYIHQYLVNIGDVDALSGDPIRTLGNGEYIYNFICVDQVTSLLPALMENLNITSVNDMDVLINTVYIGNVSKFKTDYQKVITLSIKQLEKLQTINPRVTDDPNYVSLVSKFVYYQELLDFCDTEMLLNNVIRPILSKYESELVWKLL